MICHNYPSVMDHVTDRVMHGTYTESDVYVYKVRFAANRGNTKGDESEIRLEFISLTCTSCSTTSLRDIYLLSVLTWNMKISLCNLQFFVSLLDYYIYIEFIIYVSLKYPSFDVILHCSLRSKLKLRA